MKIYGNPRNEIGDGIKAMKKLQKQLDQFMLPAGFEITKQQKEIGRLMDKQPNNLFSQIGGALEYSGWVGEEVKRFQGFVGKNFFSDLRAFQRRLEEAPKETREALRLMGDHGWYLDLDMSISFVANVRDSLERGCANEAEEEIAKHFEERLECIEQEIVCKFPSRGGIIQKAIAAHRRGEYELSIPVLLANVDGICEEVIGVYFFMRKNGKPGTAEYAEQGEEDTYGKALLSPLAENHPIRQSAGDRDPGFSGLNRHKVLHGESIDYGTKYNSLKAISLINYVAQVLESDDGVT